jgi:hypothetical protein
VRSGALGTPRRGVGRLALETGVPVVPVAVIGTEEVRRGWRIRPRKVRLRVGRPLNVPTTGTSSPALAQAVTDRVWSCVSLQWEWLGGTRAPEPQPKPAEQKRPRSTFARHGEQREQQQARGEVRAA